MYFYFLDNRTISIDDMPPVPIGSTFVDFLNLDLQIWINNIEKAARSINEEIEWDRKSSKTIRKHLIVLLDAITGIHPYFKIFHEGYYNGFNRLMKIKKRKITIGDGFVEHFKYEAEIFKIYQNIFSQAAINCIDVDKISPGVKAIDLLYEYGINKLDPKPFKADGSLTIANSAIQEYEIIDTENGKIIVEKWDVDSIYPTCYQEFFKMVIGDILIKKCANCGQYFLPLNRIDTLYCDKKYKNSGKTCKDIGAMLAYKNKINSTPALVAYNKAYQSKYAKLVKPFRNDLNQKKAATDRLKKWVYEAKNKISQYEKGEISEEELISWLKI